MLNFTDDIPGQTPHLNRSLDFSMCLGMCVLLKYKLSYNIKLVLGIKHLVLFF